MASQGCCQQPGGEETSSSHGGAGGRKHRVGGKAAQAVFNKLMSEQKNLDEISHIADIVAACKNDSVLQTLVRSVIKKHAQSTAPERLKRGVAR
eukprot:8255299-Lingulodinium_polyedra.AAC.1